VAARVSAFEDFYDEHYRRVVGALRVGVGSMESAEDAAQEAFAKALVRWRRVSTMSRPASWVYVVAVRELRRRERLGDLRRARDSSLLQPVEPDHADSVVSAETFDGAIDRLPPRQRLAVALRFHADLSVPEISRAMRCSEGTVKSTLHAALQRLQVELSDDFEGTHDGR
jgi:RNA polymerase sigma-70 factor (ECF subfamily)